ncbi:MAG: hypothetical protein AB7S83_04225 [Candidatus Methanomethylophilaceae archaeon]|jgi:hypothetical protein
MALKGEDGFTAMADAIFFIILTTIAFSVLLSMSGPSERGDPQDADDILPLLLETDIEIEIDRECGPVKVRMCEGLIYDIYTDCGAGRAATEILDSHFMREGAYALDVRQGDNSYTLGTGTGIPVSSCTLSVTGDFFSAVYVLTVY